MDKFLDEYIYVKKVVSSCVTDTQFSNAKKWAENWAKRAKENYSDHVLSWTDLYLNVIEK
jgi:hypothetical protein